MKSTSEINRMPTRFNFNEYKLLFCPKKCVSIYLKFFYREQNRIAENSFGELIHTKSKSGYNKYYPERQKSIVTRVVTFPEK